LKHDEYIILEKLIEVFPDYVNYSNFLDVFSVNLGYESKKKKVQHSIISLDKYLMKTLKTSSSVFIFKKNIEDKREKQVRIK
tara:strand:- start:156 stop:401 length:246 start_codon:yes stop_codon:yes gene_type:complete